MSAAAARAFFVLVLIINVVLWSNSRYGPTLPAKSVLHTEGSLVRRISHELMHPGEIRISEDECFPIFVPPKDQCSHVEELCPSRATFLSIDYLHFYFCAEPALRPLLFVVLVSWLIFLFSTLGISASDFFSPNLASIAQLLGLDENVAGVTFLAFGNGSPDLFSTLSAMRANSGSLAIGELLGAASFIVSCVVGSMCIIKPFRVHKVPFLRDVGFFTIAVAVVLLILYDGEIRMLESGSLIGMYVLYALIVVVGSWWEGRLERRREREALVRNEYSADMPTFPPYSDEPSTSTRTQGDFLTVESPTPTRARATSTPEPPRLHISLPSRPRSRSPSPSPRVSQLPSFSLVGALEFRDVVAALQNETAGKSLDMFESPVTPYAAGRYHHRTLSNRSSQSRPLSMRSSWHRDEESFGEMAGSVHLDQRRLSPSVLVSPSPQGERRDQSGEEYFTGSHSQNDLGLTNVPSMPSIYRTPASPSDDAETGEELFVPPTKRQRAWRTIKQILHTLFPTLHHFRQQSALGKIASLVAVPAVMLLTLTLPVVVVRYENSGRSPEKLFAGGNGPLIEFEEEGVERVLIAEEEVDETMHELAFSKWLMAVQCILGPLFCAGILFKGNKYEGWILLACAVTGCAIGTLVLIFAENGTHPSAKMARCSMGFVVAVVWIMAIADEVVNVLQAFGNIFGLSDAIIGLTIFAVGNSLADLVANMSVAVFAPIMGFSACFGGPMLNILLGIGLSGTWIVHSTHQSYHIKLSTTLLVSAIGLLILLAATLIFVPLNDYYLTKRWGMLLIASYLVIMTINVIVEIKQIK
ncbi:Putative cation exchanger C3A12.06c [Leucoagaricus sp. SymC.cos]|nr:Putative cation exchanger C3A12.06c [Leucoagaricus sp. SymC.cos]